MAINIIYDLPREALDARCLEGLGLRMYTWRIDRISVHPPELRSLIGLGWTALPPDLSVLDWPLLPLTAEPQPHTVPTLHFSLNFCPRPATLTQIGDPGLTLDGLLRTTSSTDPILLLTFTSYSTPHLILFRIRHSHSVLHDSRAWRVERAQA